jgi:hypothetical protein
MGPAPNDNMHSEDKVIIPKLADNGSNWIDNRDRVVWLLESQNIDEHIEHNAMPSSYTTAGNFGGQEAEKLWKKEETNIKQVIGPSLLRGTFSRIKGQKTVHRVWATLKLIYKEKTRVLAADLMQGSRNARCGEDNNLRTHFERLGGLREQLAGMGELISDEDYTDILIASLPSYEACCPHSVHGLLSFDAREGAARDTGTDDLLDVYFLLPPTFCRLQSANLTCRVV